MATTEPIRDKKLVQALAKYWLDRGNVRNHGLIVVGVCTALRISDVLSLRWEDVYNFELDAFRSHLTIIEGKTAKVQVIALSRSAVAALGHMPRERHQYIFSGARDGSTPLSRVQAWRIIKAAAAAVGAPGAISCHSLRKTFGYFAWKSGVLPVMLMDLYNHSSYDITRRYLGISQDERDGVYLGLTIF